MYKLTGCMCMYMYTYIYIYLDVCLWCKKIYGNATTSTMLLLVMPHSNTTGFLSWALCEFVLLWSLRVLRFQYTLAS